MEIKPSNPFEQGPAATLSYDPETTAPARDKPDWHLPCPDCGACLLRGLDDIEIPGAKSGVINGRFFLPNPFLQYVSACGKIHTLQAMTDAFRSIHWINEYLPNLRGEGRSNPGDEVDVPQRRQMFWQPFAMFRGSGLHPDEFDLTLLPRFCRLISRAVEQELLRLIIITKPFLSAENQDLREAFFQLDLDQIRSLDFGELKAAIDDRKVCLAQMTLAGVSSPSIEELVAKYWQENRRKELLAALLYVLGQRDFRRRVSPGDPIQIDHSRDEAMYRRWQDVFQAYVAKFQDQVDLRRVYENFRPSFSPLKYQSVQDPSLPLGLSRLHWLPDLPKGVDWPQHNGQALDFLAQINLADLEKGFHPSLPDHGWLYFFCEGDYWDKPVLGNKVLFYAGPLENLTRVSPPPGIKPPEVIDEMTVLIEWQPGFTVDPVYFDQVFFGNPQGANPEELPSELPIMNYARRKQFAWVGTGTHSREGTPIMTRGCTWVGSRRWSSFDMRLTCPCFHPRPLSSAILMKNRSG
jgi:hypothetical protein